MSDQRSINDYLPNMLLTEVFLYLLSSPQDRNPQFNNTKTIICTVCRYWHDIIVGYPKLWSTFRLNPICQQLSPSILNIWLQRSANMPITIYINSRRGFNRDWRNAKGRQYHLDMMSFFSQHITRWKRLDVESPGIFMCMIQDVDFTSAHLLEEVSLHIVPSPSDTILHVFLALQKAPNLTSLKYNPDNITESTVLKNPRVAALFKRLGVLHINGDIQASKALDVIRTCVSANRIHLCPTYMHGETMIMASSEILSILELTIYGDRVVAMLGYLHLPQLKVLSVRCRDAGGHELARVVSELVGDPSRHTLQVLTLHNIGIGALRDFVRTRGLSRIPIVDFRLLGPKYDMGATDRLGQSLREELQRWEGEIDNRFRMCLTSTNDNLVFEFAVGWVDSRWYEQHRQSLPCDIFDNVDVGGLLV